MFKVFIILLVHLLWGFRCSFRLRILGNHVIICCLSGCIRNLLCRGRRFLNTIAWLRLYMARSSCRSSTLAGTLARFHLGDCPLWSRIILRWGWKCQDSQASSNANPFTKDRSLRIDVLLLCNDQSSFWLQAAFWLKANPSKLTISTLV